MPAIRVRREIRWPASVGRIDWSNGITRNLLSFVTMSQVAGYPYGLVSGLRANSGTMALVSTPGGPAQAVANDNTKVIQLPNQPWMDTLAAPLTILAYARHSQANVGGYQGIMGVIGSNARVFMGIGPSRDLYFSTNNGSDAFSSLIIPASATRMSTIAMTYNGSQAGFFLDGQTQNVSYTTTSTSTSNTLRIGGNGGSNNFPGDVATIAIWSRVLTTEELMRLQNDPWLFHTTVSPNTTVFIPDGAGAVTAAYAATLGSLSFSGVAARTLPANTTGTYAATLGSLTAALTASFTAAPNRTATYAATLGDTVFAGVAARTLPASAAGTYAATLGDTTFAGVAARTLPANASATYAATLGDTTFAGVSSVGGAGSATADYAATLGSLALDAVANRSIPGIGFEPVGVAVAVRPKGSRYRFPAQTRVNINSANPLARHVQWLAAPGISRIEATKGRTGFLTTAGSASWAADGKYGLCLDSTSQSNGGAYWLSPQLSLGTSYTMGMLCKLDTLSAVGQQKIICVPYRNDSSWSSPFAGLGWYAVATTGAWGHEYSTTTPTRVSLEGGSGYFDTDWHYYVMVRSGANLTFYRDGSQHSTGVLGTNSAPDLSNGAGVHFGQRSYLNNGEGMDGKMAIGWIMDRALTSSEIDYMFEDPWALVVSRRNWAPIIASGQALPVTYSATLGNTTLAGVASVGASGSATATYAATLGSLVFAGTATFTAAPARSATYAATLGNTVFAGVASRALPGNVTATFAATLGSVVFAGVAGDFTLSVTAFSATVQVASGYPATSRIIVSANQPTDSTVRDI
jgi:hypothetical protein